MEDDDASNFQADNQNTKRNEPDETPKVEKMKTIEELELS